MLFIAIGALIQGLTELLLELGRFYHASMYVDFYTWNLRKLVLCSAVGITSLIFGWLTPGNFWWKSIFAMFGVVLIALVPQHVLALYGIVRSWISVAHIYASLGVSVAVLPLLFFACWSDARRLVRRDWLHWAGVIALVLTALVEGSFALYWLLRI